MLARNAERVAMPKVMLARRFRVPKELGLTESLAAGYRLSPRGRAFVETFGDAGRGSRS